MQAINQTCITSQKTLSDLDNLFGFDALFAFCLKYDLIICFDNLTFNLTYKK